MRGRAAAMWFRLVVFLRRFIRDIIAPFVSNADLL